MGRLDSPEVFTLDYEHWYATPWAMSLLLGDDKSLSGLSTTWMLFHNSIWFISSDTIRYLSVEFSVELLNRKLKVNEHLLRSANFFLKKVTFWETLVHFGK